MYITELPFHILIILIISVIATKIYSIIYNKRINKRLRNRTFNNYKKQKPMMSPNKFFLIWILSMIGIFFILVVASGLAYENVHKSHSETILDDEYVHDFSTWFYTKEDIKNSMLYDTKPTDEINGYTRKAITKGDVVFTCYEITLHGLGNFPDFIVNIQYNGKEPLEAVMLKTSRKEFSESCFMDKPEISQDGIWIDIYDPLIFCEPPIKLYCYVLNKEQYKNSQDEDGTVNFDFEKNSELKESIKLKCNNK